MHSFIASLQQALPAARIHLMGHSFGCIVVSSILGGPGGTTTLPRPVDSLVLVQGAFSLLGIRRPHPRRHQPWILQRDDQARCGARPDRHHSVDPRHGGGDVLPIGREAGWTGRLRADLPEFGAVGTDGIQGVGNLAPGKMLLETATYEFAPGKIHNLDCSQFIAKMEGSSGAHSDIAGPQVAHAIWQAALGGTIINLRLNDQINRHLYAVENLCPEY